MVGITFALTALALGIGALYPNYDTENVAEIPTSFGGLLFMMAAVIYLGGVVILEGWPVYLYLSGSLEAEGAVVSLLPLVLGLTGASLLTGLAIWLPLRAGARRIGSMEV
jgi:ABC-2 type transport system permease protein